MRCSITIVCNAALWIERNLRHHAPYFDRQVVVEGASQDGDLGNGLLLTGGKPNSTDGTLEILERMADELPNLCVVSAYRRHWNGKTEMMNAGLEHCEPGLVMQIDADEFWFGHDIGKIEILLRDTDRTDVEFYARHFVPTVDYHTLLSKEVWGNQLPWRRAWKWDGVAHWASHEPPRFVHTESVEDMDLTYLQGITMYHYGYATEADMRRREQYYAHRLKRGELVDVRRKWLAEKESKRDLKNSPWGELVRFEQDHPVDVTFLKGI